MTRRARSGSPHNKIHMDKTTNYQPCPPLTLISDHHNAIMFPLLPTSPGSRQRSSLQKLHTEGSSHAPPTFLGKHEVRTGFSKKPSFSSCQPCQRFHCLTCLPRFLRHLGAGGPSDPPTESLHSLSPLTRTPYLSPGSREGCPLVFSSHDPAACAAGPSSDFHSFILEFAAMISRIVEYILDHTAWLSSFSLKYCCHSSDISFHT